MSAAEQYSTPEALALDQRVSLRAMLWLSLRNGLLNLVTLTLYRFWGKTKVRRQLWSSTYLNDEPFEYTGRGMELFLGFLVATLVVVAPFLLLVFAAQFLGPVAAALTIAPLYLFMFFLLGFGSFTALRYLVSRTSWRGVRMQLEGSASGFGLSFLGYLLLAAVSLGWFWPAAARRLAARIWGGLRFGDRRFRYDLDAARRERIYPTFALGWVAGFIGYVVLTTLSASMFAAQAQGPGAPTLEQLGLFYLIIALAALAAPIVFAPYQAALLRSVAAGVQLETGAGELAPSTVAARFHLRVRWPEIAWLNFSNLLLTLFSLGLLLPLVQARTTRFVINRLESEGRVDFSTIGQTSDKGPRRGEGLADLFGVGAI